MKTRFKRLPNKIIATCLALAPFSVWAEGLIYKVKDGETLSQILQDHGIIPLYGKYGSVKKAFSLNRHKISKKGNFITTDKLIELPMIARAVAEEKCATPQETIKPVEPIILKNDQNEQDDRYPYSHFTYSSYLAFLRADSSHDSQFGGSSITAVSKRGVGVDLAWDVFYDDKISFMGFGKFEYFSFYQSVDYSLNKLNIDRLGFGVAGSYNYSPGLKLTSKLSLNEITFTDVVTPTKVNVENISVPEINFGIEKTLLSKKKLLVTGDLHVLGILPSSQGNYKSQFGMGGGAALNITYKNKTLFINYNSRSLQINEIKNAEKSIQLGMRFLGEDD